MILLIASASDDHLTCHVASVWSNLVSCHRYEFALLILSLNVRSLSHHVGSTTPTYRLQIDPTILAHVAARYRALLEVL